MDDRRHDSLHEGDVVTHLASAFSVRDLHEQVAKSCPSNTPIPSIQWLRLQFWPKHSNCGFAKRQTGKLNIKFMIQSRQFRKTHIDSHYASAVFRYQKEFAIKYRDHCYFVCMDDKHTVKVGEPQYPVAAVERGKQVLVSHTLSLQVADHDFTKFSMTPSVCFFVNVPESIAENFYTGDVYVGLKENAFQPSSPIPHMTELNCILSGMSEKPVLLLYTDGCPDHRLTYISVQISLIALFLEKNFDYLCAVRTPPYNSWKNPAERIMSILNIGLQSVGIMRTKTSSYEKELKSCNSLADVRSLAMKHPDVEYEVLDAVAPVKALLQGIFIRLQLKDSKFQTFEAASKHDMDSLWKNILQVDENITPATTTKLEAQQMKKFQKFIETHCRFRSYMVSIKKCGLPDCDVCKPIILPPELFLNLYHLPDPIPVGDHYKDFDSMYGKEVETSEDHCPSKVEAVAKSGGMPFTPTAQTANNVKVVVQCCECEKWRLIYSRYALTTSERSELQQILEIVQYSCGSNFVDIECAETSVLQKVFCRLNLTCSSPIEIPYYSTRHEPLCFYCGSEKDLAESEVGKHPICNLCLSENKKPTASRKRKKH